jgi:putative restriction endonuclease
MRCAVTGERTRPVLDAAHIKPFSLVKEHSLSNGLLLRKDLHKLFDDGYVTVTPDRRFLVSKAIRAEFENGRDYYALGGTVIREPLSPEARPANEYLAWHAAERFKG